MFSLFKTKSLKVGGHIAHFQLEDWWKTAFSENEKVIILKTYQPLELNFGRADEIHLNSLIYGDCSGSDGSKVEFLGTLAEWFNKEEYREIAYKFLSKAEQYLNETAIVDLHFYYGSRINVFYRHRERDEFALEEAIKACKEQITISSKVRSPLLKELQMDSLPEHKGFEQLAIIQEKRKDFEAVIKLAKTANEEGWSGDWNNRINRCERKLNKIRGI